ncbi:MAG: tripartite tricarboxylate transporter substrate binding protein [Betaproteobacteria bacterium]|nr:tripartite tricarboxylate transporter substrate binding protein [Betaproteobacteria bacterium]
MTIHLRVLLVAVLSLSFALPALGQSWPSRPIKILVPFAPGGSSDLAARLVAQRLQEALGQAVLVENRPGAGGILATDAVAKSAPNGYTLLLAVAGPYITAPLLQNTPYDPLRDFAPVSTLNGNPQVLVVHPDVPATNVRELIALAKAKPGKLNFSTSGPGALTEVSAIIFNQMAGVQITLVPYKGGTSAVTAILSGEAHVHFTNPSEAIPQTRAGKVRALAVTGAKAFAPMPTVPTIAESGLPGFVVETWNGVVAPAGTPPEIVNRLSDIIQALTRDPSVRQRMADTGMSPMGESPEEFKVFIQAQLSLWSRFFREYGIKAPGK